MATASTRAPARPARRLQPDRVSRFQISASAWRPSAPLDGGTDGQPIDVSDLMIVTPYLPGRDRIDFSDFDPPVVFEVRAAFRYFDRFVVVCRVEDEITAHHLFGLGVRAVNHARLPVAHRDMAPALLLTLVASAVLAFGLG